MAGVEEYQDLDPASGLLFRSLQQEEAALTREILAAEAIAAADIEISFDGGTVEGHTIQAGFLATALEHIQGLVTGMAEIKSGQASDERATRVPANIVAGFGLRVAAMQPGSFTVLLNLPETPEQMSMVPGSGRQEIVDAVAGLFTEEAVEGQDNIDEFLRTVRYPRVRTHYQGLLKAMQTGAAVMKWSTGTMSERVVFTREQANQRIEWLELHGERVESLSLQGILEGGNVQSRRFDLKVGDEHYPGRVAEEAVESMRSVRFGATVDAEIRVITKYHEDAVGLSKTEYELVDVRPAKSAPGGSEE